MSLRKGFFLAVAAIATIALWYVARFEGDLKPVDPLVVAPLHAADAWQAQPTLLQNSNEPTAIYVVTGLPGSDGLFEALRLDVNSGAQSSVRIRFGPNMPYIPFVPFDSAEQGGIMAVELRGLTLRRPAPYLFKFPGPGGPGFHLEDSATGVVHIAAGTGNGRRTLLTVNVINSNRVPEMRSYLWLDRPRSLAAFLWRGKDIWTLYLFSLSSTKT